MVSFIPKSHQNLLVRQGSTATRLSPIAQHLTLAYYAHIPSYNQGLHHAFSRMDISGKKHTSFLEEKEEMRAPPLTYVPPLSYAFDDPRRGLEIVDTSGPYFKPRFERLRPRREMTLEK